jgi:HAD superfamily hydrolase (TIGR01549 family)
MRILGVIFDLGHTLMHLNGTWPEVMEQGVVDLAAFVDGQGLGLDGQSFAQAFVSRREEGYARAQDTMREVTAESTMRWTLARFGLTDPALEFVQGGIDAYFACEESRWRADPAAIPVLRELAGQGLRLGMFSNATDDRFIQRQVDRLGFRAWLDPALSSAGTSIRKPDLVALQPILAAWDLPPEAVVMVGDTLEADILGAQRAGMCSVWLQSREDARQEGQGWDEASQHSILPDATIYSLKELPACIRSL